MRPTLDLDATRLMSAVHLVSHGILFIFSVTSMVFILLSGPSYTNYEVLGDAADMHRLLACAEGHENLSLPHTQPIPPNPLTLLESRPSDL